MSKFINKVVVNDDTIKVLYYTPNPYGTGAYKELEDVSLSEVATIEKDWLRKSNSMRNFEHRFDIRTFQAERGKYRIEIVN